MEDNSQPKPHKLWKRILFFLKFLEIRLRFVVILAVTALIVGYWDNIQNYYERWQRNHSEPKQAGLVEAKDQEFEYFCAMHPFVVRDQSGKCPICGMDLVKRKKGAPAELPEGVMARVQASPERVMQAGVEVEPVAYRPLTRTVRTYGVIEPDETRTAKIIARFPGRIEELMVNAEGMVVSKGQPLARIYSPKYLAATQEYLQALAMKQNTDADTKADADDRQRAEQLASSARRRLLLAGFTNEQLDSIAQSSKADDSVTLYSPLAGTVLEKNVLLGNAVDEMTTLYTIADLSKVWIQALTLEADISAVKKGMPVEVTSVSRPGEMFYGTVDFIYPTLNPENRSVKVRIVVDNPDGKLKPGMYVTAVMSSPVGRYGEPGSFKESTRASKTMAEGKELTMAAASGSDPKGSDHSGMKTDDPKSSIKLPTETQEDADKFLEKLAPGATYYACPMHAEVVSDKPGDCPKCGMHLEKKQKSADKKQQQTSDEQRKVQAEGVLSVPESAVIDTGARKIVYVEASPGVYDAHEVTLGPRAGDYYQVLAGLSPGDRIVSRGSFLIDAEARLNPSNAGMTSGGASGHKHEG